MLRLQPELRRIVVIGGTAEVDREMLARVERAAKPFTERVDFEFWRDRTLAEVRQGVQALPPKTAILYSRMFRDGAGQALISSEVGRWIGQFANAPVYTMVDTMLGTGALGGAIASAEAFGRHAGELARKILTADTRGSLPFEIRSDTVPTVDWRALKRWGISEGLLPPDTVVRFKQPSVWEHYRAYIVAALLIFLLQAVMIAALVLERRQRLTAQASLRHSQEMMELATHAGGLGLWSRDLADGAFWANAGMRSLFGFPPDAELRYDDFIRRVHPDDRERMIGEVERAEAAGKPFEVEYRIRPPEGSERWILAKGRTVTDTRGLQIRRMGVVSDITERKQTEQVLRESEDRFRTVANAAPVMIWMSGPDKLCTFVNNRWLEFTGRTVQQELGNGWAENVHTEDVSRCLETYVKAFDARREFRIEYRLRRRDGEYRYVLDHGVPRSMSHGTFPGYIGTCTDITDIKRAQESLDQQRAFLRKVIDINPNFIFAKDRAGRFTLANQAVAEAYGVNVEDLIGRTDAELNPRRQEVEFFRRMDLEVMTTLQDRFIPEERLTDAKGKVRWLQTVKRPIVDSDGVATQVLGTSTDITQRKTTEMELQRQRAELAHVARVSIMGHLSASLAHELNQPLTAILSNARAGLRFMASDPPQIDEIRPILEDIVEANTRAADIIRGMRTFLRKEETPEFASLDVATLISDVLALLHSDAIAQDVRVTVVLDERLPPARGDRVQLQQVLLNILLNAFDVVKECPPDERQVTLRAERDGATLRVAISDSGPGLTGEALDRVFQPFYTTKADGLGMGLPICRTIIEAHGGSLWAENNPQRGATFYFTVPLDTSAVAA
jgi:PAS domain S-box-containing protein